MARGIYALAGAAPVLRRLLRTELKDAHAVPVAGNVMRDVITLDDFGVLKPGAGKEPGQLLPWHYPRRPPFLRRPGLSRNEPQRGTKEAPAGPEG